MCSSTIVILCLLAATITSLLTMFSYFSSTKEEAKVPETPKDVPKEMMTAIAKIDNFPSKIEKPFEQTRFENLTTDETKISEYISTNYKQDISKRKFWTNDIIPRFVTDTYYIKTYDERLKLTCSRFEQFLKHCDEYNFDDILSNPKLNAQKDLEISRENTEIFPLYYYGIDKMGHPILWDNGGSNGKGEIINKLFCNDDFKRASKWRLRIKRMESNLYLRLSKHYKCSISRAITVIDLKNATVSDFYTNRQFNQWFLRSSSELFPETAYKVFLINAPWAFQMIWKICCNFLDDITVEKTKILGSDYLDELLKYIDIDMIPKEFGGKGKWEPRPGNVPKDFPFQMDDLVDNDDDDSKDNDDEQEQEVEDKEKIKDIGDGKKGDVVDDDKKKDKNIEVDENVIAYQQAVYNNDLTEEVNT